MVGYLSTTSLIKFHWAMSSSFQNSLLALRILLILDSTLMLQSAALFKAIIVSESWGALNEDKVLIEIRNKLSVGDTLELIRPGKIEPLVFKIDNLWDAETEEEISTVNPGKAEQKVILKIPTKVSKGWIIRRRK